MKEKRVLLIALFVLLAVSVTTTLTLAQGPTGTGQPRAPHALAGTAFTYQGQLKNNGSVVNGTCNFQFVLWDSAVLGSQVGTTVTVPSVSVTNGLFTTPIDFGANAFNGDARYLGIAVACPSGSYIPMTSRQAMTPAPMALALPGLYTQQNGTSPNVIGGYSGNTVDSGLHGATISGGGQSGGIGINHVSGNDDTISGGYANSTSGTESTISGGNFNNAIASDATVGGGNWNTANGSAATIGGGVQNAASGIGAFVGGGGYDGTNFGGNQAIGNASTIGGGIHNTTNNYESTVGGGYSNTASGVDSTVGGGGNNTASGTGAFVGGGGWDGTTGAGNQAQGKASMIGGGISNTVTSSYATIGGGVNNTVSGGSATVGGGSTNTANGNYATVGGGINNTASNLYATVTGGADNMASNYYAIVGGGVNNTASNQYATVGGGNSNTASGSYATVPGGSGNIALGNYSFAAGYGSTASHGGAFVWTCLSCNSTSSTAPDQFIISASGGITMYTNIGLTTGVRVLPGSGTWSSVSDRNLKANFQNVNSQDVLARLAAIPVQTWNYKAQDASIRHIGPMAQDFYAAFNVGEDDTHLTEIDESGVAFAAIQGLNQIEQAQAQEITALKSENAAQQKQIADLDARLTALEQSTVAAKSPPNDFASNGWMLGALLVAAVLVGTRRWGGTR